MKRLILTLATLAMLAALSAELDTLWTATIDLTGQNSLHGVCIDDNGDTYAVGFTTTNGGPDTDGLIVKMDEAGQVEWSLTPGGEGWDYLEDAVPRAGGGCVAVGVSNEIGNNDGWACAVDAGGNLLWQHAYGGDASDRIESIIALPSGYLLCGGTQSSGLGEEDIWLIRLDAAGNTLWTRTHGSAAFDRGYDVLALPDGGFVVVGASNIYNDQRNSEIYLLKLDDNGDELAFATFNVAGTGQVDYDAAFEGCLMPDGSIMVVGATAAEGVELMDIALLRVDQDLNELASARYELEGFYDFGYGIVPSVRTGGCVISGTTRSFSDCLDHGLLMCVDDDMNVAWSEVFTEPLHCGRYKLDVAPDGDIVQCGWKRTGDDASTAIVQRLRDRFLDADFEAAPSSGHAPLQGMLRSRCAANPALQQIEWDIDHDGVYETIADSVAYSYDQPGYRTIGMRANNGGDWVETVIDDCIRVFDGESCLEFSPNSSVASCSPSSQLHLLEAITVEAWIRPNGWGESALLGGRIADKGSWGLYICQSNPALADSCLGVFLRTEGATMAFGATATGGMPLDEWLHVAFSYSAVDGAHAYTNGIERAVAWSAQPSGALLDNAETPLLVGNSQNGQAGYDGLIDELRVWGCVRTPEQLQSAMHGTIEPTDQLAAYWRMNEGFGATCGDNSLWEHTLALQNTGWRQGTPFESTPAHDDTAPSIPASRITTVAPNPFNPETSIRFELAQPDHVRLAVYNIRGQRVATLLDRPMPAGAHSLTWRAEGASSGVYFVRLECGDRVDVRKVVLLK